MAYAMFRCCVTAEHLPDEERLTAALLERLKVDTAEIPLFGCCGYPLQNIDVTAALIAAARNLALAERVGKDILTTCACCDNMLRHSSRRLTDPALREKVNEHLALEGLEYTGATRVQHLLSVLMETVGIERIATAAVACVQSRNVVIHSGCKLSRPVPLDSPDTKPGSAFLAPLIEATGAVVLPWGVENGCCGSGILNTDQGLARAIGREKVLAADNAGADSIVTACPFCRLQLRQALPEPSGIEVLSIVGLLSQSLGIVGETSQPSGGVVIPRRSSGLPVDKISSLPCRAAQSDPEP
jgi:heterodisulfide reductase subunit B